MTLASACEEDASGAAESRARTEQWSSTTDTALVSTLEDVLRTHAVADGQYLASAWGHRYTYNDNVSQYQNVCSNLKKKVKATRQLHNLLTERASAVSNSIEQAEQGLNNLWEAVRVKDEPLKFCTWRMEQRKQRPESELVHDALDVALEKEHEALTLAHRLLRDHCDKAEATTNTLRQWYDELQEDHLQKLSSLKIDEQCIKTAHSRWPQQGTPRLDPELVTVTDARLRDHAMRSHAVSTVAERRRHPAKELDSLKEVVLQGSTAEETRQVRTLSCIAHAREAERDSARLLCSSARLISKTDEACASALRRVERAIQRRISEMELKTRQLESFVQETAHKADMMSHTMCKTGANLRALAEPGNLCSVRTQYRHGRTHHENILDPAAAAIDVHRAHLDQNASYLYMCQDDEAAVLHAIANSRKNLEADLLAKQKALQIDRRCQSFAPTVQDYLQDQDITARPHSRASARPESRTGTPLPETQVIPSRPASRARTPCPPRPCSQRGVPSPHPRLGTPHRKPARPYSRAATPPKKAPRAAW